ncbi:response regulator [Hyphomicrobium sp. 99]|uniref:response regulator n=1 Tax=Hyphomicrobium sp. 99 TaxID=1163419 RepID=UPI0006963A09|nr:response regulator [Hyphomicrobium sp. 99]
MRDQCESLVPGHRPGSQPKASGAPLQGLRILVMEDEPIIALDLRLTLEDAGAFVIGPATTLAAAIELIQIEMIDCALLDVRMGRESAFAAAEKLSARGLRWVFHTGNADAGDIMKAWPSCPILLKPADPPSVVRALATLSPHI